MVRDIVSITDHDLSFDIVLLESHKVRHKSRVTRWEALASQWVGTSDVRVIIVDVDVVSTSTTDDMIVLLITDGVIIIIDDDVVSSSTRDDMIVLSRTKWSITEVTPMKIMNLTPHAITLRTPGGEDITLPSVGVARVATQPGTVEHVEGLPVPVVPSPTYGEIEGLPDPEPGVVFIVSALVASRAFGRADVFSPGTGPADGAVRNEKGHIVAVTRLVRAPAAP